MIEYINNSIDKEIAQKEKDIAELKKRKVKEL